MSWRNYYVRSRYRGVRENPARNVQAYIQPVDENGQPTGGACLVVCMPWGEFDFPHTITVMEVPSGPGFGRLPKYLRNQCEKKLFDRVTVEGDTAVYLCQEVMANGKVRAKQGDGS